MNKKNISVSAVVILMFLASIPLISDTVKADTPDVKFADDNITCNTKPIQNGDPEDFNIPIRNGEGYAVSVDLRWYYQGDQQNPNQWNFVVPAYKNCYWCDNKTITWLGNYLQKRNVTVELLLNSTGELLARVDTNFTYWIPDSYYFDTYDTCETPEDWASNPSYMVNGMIASYASTGMVGDVELLNGNTCTGYETGNVTEVYIRAKGYYSSNKHTIKLTPIFGGTTDGADYEFDDITTSSAWSDWFEITYDHMAPASWTWNDVDNLDCDVTADGDLSMFTLFCSQVEILVCHD
jgi:hypothetical protein